VLAPLAAAISDTALLAGLLNQDAAHRLGGAEEVSAIRPVLAVRPDSSTNSWVFGIFLRWFDAWADEFRDQQNKVSLAL
jgi:hypothetical protein